ncbi:MAG: peptide deformylase [Patescibacteria group bacterium]|jgi:peptide deformylase
MILPIVTAPQSVLSTPTRQITTIDKKIRELIRDMTDTLLSCKDPLGVGLAAPQVGVPLALCIVKPTRKSPVEVFINPKIVAFSNKKTIHKSTLEGCLSIPKVWSHVNRPTTVDVEYETMEGVKLRRHITGYEAHIIQHEVDHLNGVLFTHQALSQHQPFYTIKRKNGEEEFVEMEL